MRATCRPRARHGLPERGRPGDRRGRSHPRQPLPGTREAWPQRVGWLPGISGVRQVLRRPVPRSSLAAAHAAAEHPATAPGNPFNKPREARSAVRWEASDAGPSMYPQSRSGD